MPPTKLDQMPVEILQLIFQYLSCGDTLWSFYNLNSYLDAVLRGCCLHVLNFQSTSKAHFDLICQHLQPTSIVSLTLSDDVHTPQQVRLFFNRFYLRDFVNLHSLTLLSVTNEDIHPILSDLSQLPRLTSLITSSRSSQPLLLGQTLNQLTALRTLSVSQGDLFDHNVTLPLYHVRVLDAGTCNFLELRRLQSIVPSLVSLKIILQANHQLQLLADVDVWSRLERLDLTLNNDTMTTFAEMHQILSHFNHLTHLTLKLCGDIRELADGAHWERCSTIVALRQFHFIFDFEYRIDDLSEKIDRVFRSFSSYFWREVKQWYVVVTTHQVYTITCFDEQQFLSSIFPLLSTAPDDRWVYSRAKRLKLTTPLQLKALARFRNVQELEASDALVFTSIPRSQRFIHLRRLILHQVTLYATLSETLALHPQITDLTLSQLDLNQTAVFPTISCLHLTESVQVANRAQVAILCRMFPSVQRLTVHVPSIQLICAVIDGFCRLQNGILYVQKLSRVITREWLEGRTRLGGRTESFTYRNEPQRLLLWINTTIVPSSQAEVPATLSPVRKQRSDKCAVQ